MSRFLSMSVVTLFLATAGCGGSEASQEPVTETPAQPEATLHSENDGHGHDQEAGEVSAMAFDGPCAWACTEQCTTYARCRQPALPTGLWDWQDKLNTINSNHAHPGCVAVLMGSNPAGHVAFVHRVDTAPNPNRIYIHESNWGFTGCNARDGSKAGLNISGFFCPRSLHTANCSGPL